ncbi:MAG: monovalent cation/H(+) antiporter subunit G [Rhodospirillales bacterium]|nr:monovalent cation/H(+) antiporter subunit G [Rhodospirillales bacterium]
MGAVLDLLSWASILSGALFIFIGTLGLLRLPDVFSRMHGAGMTDTLGAGLLVLGMLLQTTDWLVAIKLVMIVAFLAFTSPTTSHALARAALKSGLMPWTRAGREVSKENPPS